MLLLTPQKSQELIPKFDALVDYINKDDPTSSVYAVIIKLERTRESVGRMSQGGSYTPYYSEGGLRLQEDFVAALREIYNAFRDVYPKNRTLFFRYNRKRQKLQMFAAGTMILTSEVL